MSENNNSLNPAPAADDSAAPGPGQKTISRSPWRWITPSLAGLAVLVIGLFGGIIIGQHTASSARGQFGTGQFGNGQNGIGTRTGGGFTAGTIASISADSVTITLAGGSTVTVRTNSDTSVTKTDKAALTDLGVGDRVTVIGTKSGDVVTAKSIAEGGLLGAFGGGVPSGNQPSGNGQ